MKRNRPSLTKETAAEHETQTIVLPKLTHLQFLALDLLRSEKDGLASPQLQTRFAELGIEHSGPKFYQLMRRLEEAGMIRSRNEPFDVAGGTVQRTVYAMTPQGTVAWNVTMTFYRARWKIGEVIE